MHIVFIARGIKHSLDRFINELQGKYLPYIMKEKDKEGNVIDKQMLLQMVPGSIFQYLLLVNM